MFSGVDSRCKQTVKCEAKIKSSTDEAGIKSSVIVEQVYFFDELKPDVENTCQFIFIHADCEKNITITGFELNIQ